MMVMNVKFNKSYCPFKIAEDIEIDGVDHIVTNIEIISINGANMSYAITFSNDKDRCRYKTYEEYLNKGQK